MTKTIAERGLAAAVALLAAASLAGAAPVAPRADGRRPEYEASANLMGRVAILEPAAEVTERWQYDGLLPYDALLLGSYARLERHLKVGAFYRLERGARHDDDFRPDAAKNWRWLDTSSRPESSLVLDATPRAALPFLPGKTWVGSVKMRYEHDFFNGQSLVRLEPELAWFWMNGLAPRATIFLRHEVALPLNFGQTTVWQRWYYLAGLWHARPWLSLGPSVALREETWSTSAAFRSTIGPGPSYQTLYRAWVAGFTVTARLPAR